MPHFIYLVPQLSPTQSLLSSALRFCVSLFSLKPKKKIKNKTKQIYIYITKSWSIAFNAAALTLCHISCHVILFFFFFFFKYNLSHNFKMVFTIFNPINVAHYLFIYIHCNPIINPVHYLFIYFHYHPIINLYN